MPLTTRSLVVLVLLQTLFSSIALGFCQLPQPRLVRAEYFQSGAVVIAHLVSGKYVESATEPDYHLYTFEVDKLLHGSIPTQFVLFDENSSGRLTFTILTGHKYLLFVNRWPTRDKDWWTADGCGNSGEVGNRAKTLTLIGRISSLRGGQITGEVTSRPAGAIANANVIAISKTSGKQFETKTRANGRFSLDVPAGEYSVQVTAAGKRFVTHWYSYEDADSVKLQHGGCVQIEFVPFDSDDARSRLNR